MEWLLIVYTTIDVLKYIIKYNKHLIDFGRRNKYVNLCLRIERLKFFEPYYVPIGIPIFPISIHV